MKKNLCVFVIILSVVALLSGCSSSKYDKAKKLYNEGKHEEALNIFAKIRDYEDSSYYVAECLQDIADQRMAADVEEVCTLFGEGKQDEAKARINELLTQDVAEMSDFADRVPDYDTGLFMDADGYSYYKYEFLGKVETTKATDEELSFFLAETMAEYYGEENSFVENYLQKFCRPKKPVINAGDIIKLGKYTMGATYNEDDVKWDQLVKGTKLEVEAIPWMVLEVQDDKMLLLSQYALDRKNVTNWDTTKFGKDNRSWESSYVRKWLDEDFFNGGVFTAEEKAQILTTNLTTAPFNGAGGCSTQDKLFLLSREEVEKYKNSVALSPAYNTAWAYLSVVSWPNANALEKAVETPCDWVLRTRGEDIHSKEGVARVTFTMMSVNADGSYGENVSNSYIRPAMWVKIPSM